GRMDRHRTLARGGSRARKRPARGQEARLLGMDALRRLRGVLYGVQHKGRGRGRPARRGVLPPRLHRLPRPLLRSPQGI
ncbi:MAG: hypothetical protein AVDCRST_MAG12-1273, partial [uncultured Rubrobacteraceae bacterium]